MRHGCILRSLCRRILFNTPDGGQFFGPLTYSSFFLLLFSFPANLSNNTNTIFPALS